MEKRAPISVYTDIEEFLPQLAEFAEGYEPSWDPSEATETEEQLFQRETWAILQTAYENLQAAYQTIGWFLYRDRPGARNLTLNLPERFRPPEFDAIDEHIARWSAQDAKRASKD